MSTLDLTSQGDLKLDGGLRLTLATGAEEAALDAKGRLGLFQGEWFLDTRRGMPYFAEILGVKNPDMRLVKQLYSEVLSKVPSFASLDEITCTLDKSARRLNVAFRATAKAGGTVSATSLDVPFIVEQPT